MEPLPVPADPELEKQIQEVQEALGAIYQQMVRRKDALKKATDAATKAALYDEFERLRKEREDLEALLHDLVDEARLSEQTAIDEALARARWLERQQEYHAQKEELIRDRQE
jgi:predicted  nucleic acid-binding Zn-ribbon protein